MNQPQKILEKLHSKTLPNYAWNVKSSIFGSRYAQPYYAGLPNDVTSLLLRRLPSIKGSGRRGVKSPRPLHSSFGWCILMCLCFRGPMCAKVFLGVSHLFELQQRAFNCFESHVTTGAEWIKGPHSQAAVSDALESAESDRERVTTELTTIYVHTFHEDS
jgi:hypothetical protein